MAFMWDLDVDLTVAQVFFPKLAAEASWYVSS
jgi:hypothetical protein